MAMLAPNKAGRATLVGFFRERELTVMGKDQKKLDEMRETIRANGGHVTMQPTCTNFAIVCDAQILRVKTLMKTNKYNFVHWQWLERCLEYGKCLPFRQDDMIQAKADFRLEEQEQEQEEEEEDEEKAEEQNCCQLQPGGCPK
jgi:hypothetical protein